MIDGASYYEHQSTGRGIGGLVDVERLAALERPVFQQLIQPMLPKQKNARIYEAATGPGILQLWFKEEGYHAVEGSDFSEKEAELARKINPAIRTGDSVADLERQPDDSLDTIVALDFLEHIPRELFMKFLRISYLKLKKGGTLVLRGPNGDSPFVGLNLYNDATHVWAYTTICLKSLIRIAGFSGVTFADDTAGSVHSGGWWKRPVMKVAQQVLSFLVLVATRQRIRYWGMSLYIYAVK